MSRNRFKSAAAALVCALLVLSCGTDGPGGSQALEDGFRTGPHAYKSIIRLWPAHHQDSVLLRELVEAFEKYPGACDEVWFCISFDKDSLMDLDAQRRSAKLMGRAAEQMRRIGVRASIQTVLLGHPEGQEAWGKPSPYPWTSVMGADGVSGSVQCCPRQPKYLEWISDVQAIYAEAVQPETFFIDDDLRLTNHDPAPSICFCDTCIGLFNEQFGYTFTRETLAKALVANEEGGEVRRRWIEFSQESLAGVARIVSRKVHKVSPRTQMGLQHASFHFNLLEGWDWNKIFDAMREETGIVPASRPGHGYYNDHSPRGMLYKSMGIARQISRLEPGITDISPEIEGYFHKATGKSSLSFCTETLLYLAYGATQMSYAMVCSGQEPVQWYADHHFKMLDKHHSFFSEYAAFNQGTSPGGLDPYISPSNVYRDCAPGEDPWAWSKTEAGEDAVWLNAIGLPLCPESERASALYIDAPALLGIPDGELRAILAGKNILVDQTTWNGIRSRLPDEVSTQVELPERLRPGKLSKIEPLCFLTTSGRRVAVLPSFSADVNNTERLQILQVADWASEGRLPVMMESPAQGVVVPRLDPSGSLRSVAYLNCTITEQEDVILRLRGCSAGERTKVVWKMAGRKDVRLDAKWSDGELLVHLPPVPAWHIGWIAVE